jgi:peptidoglycan/xylan/chitin deacetylase (PgdA/CDA1 family)
VRWDEMNKTVVSISFDDGREDTYRVAYDIMKKYGLTGTINVITGYVDKTWDWEPGIFYSSNGPVSLEQLKEMKDYGFEVASHGDKHVTEEEDIMKSIQKLRGWQLIGEKVGFSIPYSKLTEKEKTDFAEFLKKNGVSYMRGGRNPQCYTFKAKILYLLYNITKIQLFYDSFNNKNCIDLAGADKPNIYDLFSVIIRFRDDPRMVVEFIKNSISRKSWIILMLHSIQDENEETFGKDPWCWSSEKFEKLCIGLKEMSEAGEISVRPIMDVIGGMG